MTTRINKIENKLIRHFSPKSQLYPLQSTKSSPQIYSDENCGKVFSNQNILNISSFNYDILIIFPGFPVFKKLNLGLQLKKNTNKKEDKQKKDLEIDQSLKSVIFKRCISFEPERCVNKSKSAAVFGFPMKIFVGEYLLWRTTAADSFIGHWSLGGF